MNTYFKRGSMIREGDVINEKHNQEVVSPLPWSLVVDELLWELRDNDYYTIGYADDIVI
jgi:hypothetical protein